MLERIKHGVLQGSILWPLFFTCYINDLPLFCSATKVYIHGDVTVLICVDSSLDVVQTRFQSDLDKLSVWFSQNKLIVNCHKTKAMLFCSQCFEIYKRYTRTDTKSYTNRTCIGNEIHGTAVK